MSHRFFLDCPIANKPEVKLAGTEAHHLIHVMRAKPEGRVTLFDGSGAEYAACITEVGRSTVRFRIVERREIDRELPLELTLGVALPKGDRQKWLVEKAVELGVTRIVPLHADRSVALPDGKVLERLCRVVVEASKQCGRNRLMQIDSPMSVTSFLESAPRKARRLLVDPGGERLLPGSGADESVFISVGPEGGFTDDELSCAASAEWEQVSLGPRILRTETAAIAMVSVLAVPAGKTL